MKKVNIIGLLLLFVATQFFVACQKDTLSDDGLDATYASQLNSDDFVTAIDQSNKQDINVSELPSNIKSSINTNYSQYTAESAQVAPKLGYLVSLTTENDTEQASSLYFRLNGEEVANKEGNTHKRRRGRCFKFEFPFTLEMPDGSEIILESKEDRSKVKAWKEANPDATDRPTPKFPVTITKRDGTSETIADQAAFDALKEECKAEWKERRGKKGHGPKGPKGPRFGKCFKVDFPHTLVMPDGTEITLESKKDRSKLRTWREANSEIEGKPTLKFPVSVTKDGVTSSIADQAAFDVLKEACKAKKNGNTENDN